MRALSLTLTLISLTTALAVTARAASLTEPSTVFYGQVTNQSAGGALMHEGVLVWTISSDGGEPLVLQTSLAPHDEGRFSYFIEVPHSVLAQGLDVVTGALPLGSQPANYQHLSITVDGLPATIQVPGEYVFDLRSTTRAATYQLDLSVAAPVSDTDGDGMPDWWEEANGLDTENDDSLLDPDGDGINNLGEFRGGTSPGIDNRGPELLTSRLTAYAGAMTGVMLRTADLDSEAADLVYTVLELPAQGSLRLRDGNFSALSAGDEFSQADVEGGLLVYDHPLSGDQSPTTFKLKVSDGTAGHLASEGEIDIDFYEPDETANPAGLVTAALDGETLPGVVLERQQMVRSSILGRELDYVVWDLSDASFDVDLTQPETEEENNHSVIITGGSGADDLSGGSESDLIAGGASDDRLTGGNGPDRFLILSTDDGNDTIADFNADEGDVLDLKAVLSGSAPWLTDYLELRPRPAGGCEIGIDFDGDDSGFLDLVVTLEGVDLSTKEDLYALVANGNIAAGSLPLPPLVTVVASIPLASEIGPEAGEFTITRLGSKDASLVVSLQIDGSAGNGFDYSFLPGTVTIPAGASSIVLPVMPFVDTIAEVSEIVQLRVLDSGTGAYETGSKRVAQVTIENLMPKIQVEAMLPIAAVSGGHEGIFLVSRSGDLDASVLLRFQIGGTATGGADYNALPVYLALAPQQTFALIKVIPRPGAVIAGGAETVVLTLTPDASYKSDQPSQAEIAIVPELQDLADWRSDHFPGAEGDLHAFATQDPGNTGLPQLLRYGFGLDPISPWSSAQTRLPRVGLENGYLVLRYREELASADLEYTVEVSADLEIWRTASASDIHRDMNSESAPWERVYRSARPVSESVFQYMRVKIQRP